MDLNNQVDCVHMAEFISCLHMLLYVCWKPVLGMWQNTRAADDFSCWQDLLAKVAAATV